MTLRYTARTPVIINYTIQSTNTWEKAASKVAGVRKWMIKANENTNNPFNVAFTGSPSTSFSNSGVGFSMDDCDLPDVYVYGTSGTIIEILYFG